MHKDIMDENCPIEITSELIGGKWKVVILWYLLQSTKRFSELKRAIPGVSKKMLTQQLRELELDGLVTRTIYPEIPPRVDYRLTELGSSLNNILTEMGQWGIDYGNIANSPRTKIIKK